MLMPIGMPLTRGYGMRKMASKEGREAGLTGIVQLCFVWQTCTWGMLKR